MEKKIIATMVALVVIAVVVVAVVFAASNIPRKAGGFTNLFDELVYDGEATYRQYLSLPDTWNAGDKKTVSDMIVDMRYYTQTTSGLTVYVTTLYFVYAGNKWADPAQGTSFYVPTTSHTGYFHVDHGMFTISVSTVTNISAEYDIGDVIELETTLTVNAYAKLAFSDWRIVDTP